MRKAAAIKVEASAPPCLLMLLSVDAFAVEGKIFVSTTWAEKNIVHNNSTAVDDLVITLGYDKLGVIQLIGRRCFIFLHIEVGKMPFLCEGARKLEPEFYFCVF